MIITALNTKKIKYTIILSAIIILLFVIQGCDDVNLSQSIQDNTSIGSETSLKSNKYCNFYSQPFLHNRCSIQQSDLIENTGSLGLNLFWRVGNDNTNKAVSPLLTFDNLVNQQLNDHNETITFAVNAGMYNESYAPIGYTVIDEEQVLSLNLNEGAGNFHLLPNGVFWHDNNGFYVTESNQMNELLQSGTKPIFATQSGPMLVINGELHPAFKANSPSTKIRNGVGICEDGAIKFVNSDVPVNFYDFASLFKDTLNCENALFLDGGIASAIYSTELNRRDIKPMGVMIGLVEKKEKK